jgi:bifunctional DNA-binding transcriptional regulator/antitoxin component of YhaV-PrlF toxin-antitoxin module
MRLGKIVNSNKKGQIVIPYEYRINYGIDENTVLNIIPHPTGLLIQPIKPEVSSTLLDDENFQRILKKTAGAWPEDSLVEQGKQHRIELKSAQKAKNEKW